MPTNEERQKADRYEGEPLIYVLFDLVGIEAWKDWESHYTADPDKKRPTYKERCRVAHMLRNLPSDMLQVKTKWEEMSGESYISCSKEADYEQMYLAIMKHTPLLWMSSRDFEIFHEYLADLIEPEPERICRNARECGDDFTCSECGYGLGYTNIEFAYCPICGAKVVEDGD